MIILLSTVSSSSVQAFVCLKFPGYALRSRALIRFHSKIIKVYRLKTMKMINEIHTSVNSITN